MFVLYIYTYKENVIQQKNKYTLVFTANSKVSTILKTLAINKTT